MNRSEKKWASCYWPNINKSLPSDIIHPFFFVLIFCELQAVFRWLQLIWWILVNWKWMLYHIFVKVLPNFCIAHTKTFNHCAIPVLCQSKLTPWVPTIIIRGERIQYIFSYERNCTSSLAHKAKYLSFKLSQYTHTLPSSQLQRWRNKLNRNLVHTHTQSNFHSTLNVGQSSSLIQPKSLY